MGLTFKCQFDGDGVKCGGEVNEPKLSVPLKFGDKRVETSCKKCKNAIFFVATVQDKTRYKSGSTKFDDDVTFVDCGVPFNEGPAIPQLTPAEQLRMKVVGGGAATLVEGGEYDQTSLIEKYSKGPKNSDIKAGVCRGQCLHWIRRVLQAGGRAGYEDMGAKKPERTNRAELTHLQGVSAQRASSDYNTKKDERRKLFEDDLASLVTKVSDGALMWSPKIVVQSSAESVRNEEMSTRAEEMKHRVAEAVDKARAEFAKSGAFANWEGLQRQLDKDFPRKKKYSGIDCTYSGLREKNESLSQFLVFIDSELKDNMCAQISFGLKSSRDGTEAHDIAVQKQGAGFKLFDPNCGVFECKDAERLKKTIDALVKGWQEVGKWELDNQFGYSLFILAMPSGKDDGAKELKYTNSVSATALFNKFYLPQAIN